MTSLTLVFPVFIIPAVFKFLHFEVFDSDDQTSSISDYGGIDLSDKSIGHGPYTCDIFICEDKETGKVVTMPEISRYQSMFVCGGSGSGKTSLIFEPLIARDLEKKYFFREVSKEMGYTALKTKIATLNAPYDNDYLNANFNLNMLTPNPGYIDIYQAYMKKMILDSSSKITYKNCGVTLVSPDIDIVNHMINVCDNYGLKYNLIDPSNKDSIGLNPFVYGDSNKIAIAISSVIKAMSMLESNSAELGDIYKSSFITHAIENTAILLKEVYPKMHEGTLPNLDDMLQAFNNFDLIEKMCEIVSHDKELAEKYKDQLTYFKRNFYKDGVNRENTEKNLDVVINQLNKLLRLQGVKSILCNRHKNIDFDQMLENADVTFVCTRRGELGEVTHKAFGLFFLISMENAVLRRPGTEKSRVPNFLYIDEFPEFICKSTEPIFTMYRKYKIGTVISAQNLAQLEIPETKNHFKETILSNCASKIFTGGGTTEELTWWADEFGQKRVWAMSNSIDFDKMKYDSKHGGVEYKFTSNFKPGKLQGLTLKSCAYKIRNDSGSFVAGQGTLNFLDSKFKEPKKLKVYDFGKFSDGVTTETEDGDNRSRMQKKYDKKFDIENVDFSDSPIKTDTTDSSYIFDNEDAIVVDLKNKKKQGK